MPIISAGNEPFFRADGQAWRWRGVTSFKLAEKFRLDPNIDPILADYEGYNLVRVFWYTPTKTWGTGAWDPCPSNTFLAFLNKLAKSGLYCELTLLTDDAPNRLAEARQFISDIKQAHPSNLFIEIGNEPSYNNIKTTALRSDLESSGLPYSSGDYEDSNKWFGTYGTAHTARSNDWVRRAHDLLEYFGGGGPNNPSEPACKAPWVADEPAKAQDVNPLPRDFYAYAAACSVLGGGATFHSQGGKFCWPFTAQEKELAKAFLDGLNIFPDATPGGTYRRVVESPNPPEGRTYVVREKYMVRCQQPGVSCPESGWTSLDSVGVAFTR